MISRALASLACAPLASLAGWLRTEMRLSLRSNAAVLALQCGSPCAPMRRSLRSNAAVNALQCGGPGGKAVRSLFVGYRTEKARKPTHYTPTHSPCPLARPEGEKRLGHYLSATARMGAGIAPFPPPLLESLAVFEAGRARATAQKER